MGESHTSFPNVFTTIDRMNIFRIVLDRTESIFNDLERAEGKTYRAFSLLGSNGKIWTE